MEINRKMVCIYPKGYPVDRSLWETIEYEESNSFGVYIRGVAKQGYDPLLLRPLPPIPPVPQTVLGPPMQFKPSWRRQDHHFQIRNLQRVPLKYITEITHVYALAGHYRYTQIVFSYYGERLEDHVCIQREDFANVPLVKKLREGLAKNPHTEHDISYYGHYHVQVVDRATQDEKWAIKAAKRKPPVPRTIYQDIKAYIYVETGRPNNHENKFSLNKLWKTPHYFPETIHWRQKQFRPANYRDGIDFVTAGQSHCYPLDPNVLHIWLPQDSIRKKIVRLINETNQDRRRYFDRFISEWATYTLALLYINWSWHYKVGDGSDWWHKLKGKDLREYAIHAMVGLRPHNYKEASELWLHSYSMDLVLLKVEMKIASKISNGVYKSLRRLAKGDRIRYPIGYTKEQQKEFKLRRGITSGHNNAFLDKQSNFDRELQSLLASGLTHSQIASQLGCSAKTVQRHLRRLSAPVPEPKPIVLHEPEHVDLPENVPVPIPVSVPVVS